MNMNMLNLVETKTILIMILMFCKFSFCNSLSCLILWAIAKKVACALSRVLCIVQCLALPPSLPLFKTHVQRLNLLQGQAILEPKQKKTQACISLGRTQTFKCWLSITIDTKTINNYMNKKIEQITINGCCGITSIWLENESKGQLYPRWVVSGKRDKDAFSIIGYYIFWTKKKLINFTPKWLIL